MLTSSAAETESGIEMGNDYRIFDRREAQARVSLPLAPLLQEGPLSSSLWTPKSACMQLQGGRSNHHLPLEVRGASRPPCSVRRVARIGGSRFEAQVSNTWRNGLFVTLSELRVLVMLIWGRGWR